MEAGQDTRDSSVLLEGRGTVRCESPRRVTQTCARQTVSEACERPRRARRVCDTSSPGATRALASLGRARGASREPHGCGEGTIASPQQHRGEPMPAEPHRAGLVAEYNMSRGESGFYGGDDRLRRDGDCQPTTRCNRTLPVVALPRPLGASPRRDRPANGLAERAVGVQHGAHRVGCGKQKPPIGAP
jgi:hypothetical protein